VHVREDDGAGLLGPDRAAANREVTIVQQFESFLGKMDVVGSLCNITEADKKAPAELWLRVRPIFPELADTMLWWLSFPTGTAGVERDFSFLTMVSANTRRRRMQWVSFRTSVLSRCYKGTFLADMKSLNARM
jgi:hypothetical protein